MHQQNAIGLMRDQATTNATITNLSSQMGWVSYRNPTAKNSSDTVTVRFVDEKGNECQTAITEYVGADEMPSLHVGDSVPIVYRRDAPTDAHLQASLTRLAHANGKMIAIGAFFLASLALAVWGLRMPRPPHTPAAAAAASRTPVTAAPRE